MEKERTGHRFAVFGYVQPNPKAISPTNLPDFDHQSDEMAGQMGNFGVLRPGVAFSETNSNV
jgi:hypothetical protein